MKKVEQQENYYITNLSSGQVLNNVKKHVILKVQVETGKAWLSKSMYWLLDSADYILIKANKAIQNYSQIRAIG